MKSQIDGGCLCGNVRYQLHDEPRQLSDCHCIDCRRASAAPFVTWGSFPRDKVDILFGEVRRVNHASRIRSFAGCCGTPLFFEEHAGCKWIDVTVASFDHPEKYSPEVEIWTEDRLPWVPLDPARPAHKQGRMSLA
jgi:hypothetical protein